MGSDPRVLTVAEREGLQQEVHELERQVAPRAREDAADGMEFRGDRLRDPQAVRSNIRHLKSTLDRDPGEARGVERARVERRLREIEPELRAGLVSDRLQRVKPGHPDFEKVVRAQMDMQRRTGKYQEWQGLRRRLDPSDRTVSDVNRHLRPRS